MRTVRTTGAADCMLIIVRPSRSWPREEVVGVGFGCLSGCAGVFEGGSG